MRKRILALAVALILFGSFSYAQHTADSIRRLLNANPPDTTKIELIRELTLIYSDLKPDSNMVWAEKGLILARKTKDLDMELAFLNSIAICNDVYGNFPEALQIYLDVLQRAEAAGLDRKKFNSLGNIALLYYDQK